MALWFGLLLCSQPSHLILPRDSRGHLRRFDKISRYLVRTYAATENVVGIVNYPAVGIVRNFCEETVKTPDAGTVKFCLSWAADG